MLATYAQNSTVKSAPAGTICAVVVTELVAPSRLIAKFCAIKGTDEERTASKRSHVNFFFMTNHLMIRCMNNEVSVQPEATEISYPDEIILCFRRCGKPRL